MKTIPRPMPDEFAVDMVMKQALSGVWDGKTETVYFQNCIWYWPKYQVSINLSRDINHHLGGWWKNPQYERCWHLSIAVQTADYEKPEDHDKNTLHILQLIFQDKLKMMWSEPPYSEAGKKMHVWHYRVFCDEHWQAFKPKGEVYSTELTERGWLSSSELKDYHERETNKDRD